DVTTRECRMRYGNRNRWQAMQGGFWKPGPHLVLEDGFEYPDAVWLDQFTVLEPDGKLSVYRNWFQDYTPESITAELSQNRFSVESLWGDLTGQPYIPDSEWIGLITTKK